MYATIDFRRFLATSVILLGTLGPAQAKYSGGAGTAAAPYQIATAADLIALGESPQDYAKHFILTADIDLDPNLPGRKVFDKAVIAPDTDPTKSDFQGTSFTGVFDGNAHKISHLTITGKDYLGLFGQLGDWRNLGGAVKDLGVVDVNITGLGVCVGGLVGRDTGDVTQCYSGGVVSGSGYVGGLVGTNGWRAGVSQCHSTGAIKGNHVVGGLVGLNGGAVSQCYSTGAVSGKDCVGGLLGMNLWGSLTQSYSTGAVSGTEEAGGLVGSCWSVLATFNWFKTQYGAVTNSLWDTQTSGQTISDGGIGRTTAKMQTAQTFLDAGWDFVGETKNGTEDIWWIDEGKDYPRLWWELPNGGLVLVVDDIESYTDRAGDEIFSTWIDGFTDGLSGSTVGYLIPESFTELTIVHGGRQSMPFSYNNADPPYYSEAYREWDAVQDWTIGAMGDLSLWIRGWPSSFLETPDGVVVMSGRGGYGEADAEGTNDQYGFCCKQLRGDGELVARVESLSNAEGWARAGVTMREDLGYSSPLYAAVTVTAAHGVSFAYRPIRDGKGVQTSNAGPQVPHWVKLVRRGNTFTAQQSEDGVAWRDISDADGKLMAVTLTMPESVSLGLCVSGQSQTATATFSHITTAGIVTGRWQAWASGSVFNSPDNLYVALQDSSGRIAVAVHPDPMAVNVSSWTQWKAPLSQFTTAGVNVSAVKRMYIGVGDRNNPQPNGRGTIYVDDIGLTKRTP